jgi:phage portal protein BeeE
VSRSNRSRSGAPPSVIGSLPAEDGHRRRPPAGPALYTSPEQRATDLLVWTIRPWLHRLERAISSLLPRTQTAKFNAGAMLRATLLDRYTAHKLGIEAGWLLPSEVRELEDRPPIPGIDDRPPPEVGVA